MSTTALASVQSTNYYALYQSASVKVSKSETQSASPLQDTLDLGSSGPLSDQQTNSVILERAMSKLKSVVDDARSQLGLSADTTLDTSAEATAKRIGDFALNFFDKYMEKHPEVSGDDARKQFADFIGGAISKGIEEARGILGSLSALNPDVTNKIDSISSLVKKQLDDFVSGK